MYYFQITVLVLVNCMLGLCAYVPLSTGQMVMCMGSLMSVGAIGGAAAYSAAGLPFPIAVLVGGLVAVLAGVIVGTLCNKLAGFILAVVTLGLGELARVVATNSSTLGGALGYKNVGFIPFSTYFPYLV